VNKNLIDLVWPDRMSPKSQDDLWVLKQEFTGMNTHDKLQYVRQKMKEHNCDCYVITALDEIAWVLNSNVLVISY
jgi:Xaa-Pro aminopeptidase